MKYLTDLRNRELLSHENGFLYFSTIILRLKSMIIPVPTVFKFLSIIQIEIVFQLAESWIKRLFLYFL